MKNELPEHWKRAISTAIQLALMGQDVSVFDGSGWEVRMIRPYWGTSNGQSRKPFADVIRYLATGACMVMSWQASVCDIENGITYRYDPVPAAQMDVAA